MSGEGFDAGADTMTSQLDVRAWLRKNPDLLKRNLGVLGEKQGEESPRPPRVWHEAADLLRKIQKLATAHDWAGLHTYNALGPDSGLHCILVREAVLFADVKEEDEPLTVMQQHWQDVLRATGQVEVYTWHPSDWTAIHARLTREAR
jgi:hypothetical protein